MHAFEDRALSMMAIGLVAALGWRMTGRLPAAPVLRDAPPRVLELPLRGRVLAVSEAIARSEGYYAPGAHGGHSLAYAINNPGLLKASPIVDGDPPTWNDTGLLVFPTADIGWTALHTQVCVMLTGASRFYEPADSLLAVGAKYAEGDPNWGANVARHLGVRPDATLADLAGDAATGESCFPL